MTDLTSNEVEAAVIGALWYDHTLVDDARDILGVSGDVFGNPTLGGLYESILEVYNKHGRYDITLLMDGLGATKMVEISGLDSCKNIANIGFYANAVLAHYVRREAQAGARRVAALAEQGAEPNEILESLAQVENQLSGVVVGDNTNPVGDSVDGVLAGFKAQLQAGGAPMGVPSGIPKLDALTGGWGDDELIIIGARPSVGKSAFALHAAAHAAASGVPVYFASLEMSAESLCSRLLLQRAGVPFDYFRTGFRGEHAMRTVTETAEEVLSLPLYIDDSSRSTIWDIRGRARRCQRKHGKGLIIVDYLQLVHGSGKSKDRHIEVGEISAGLKQLARDQKCPVVALCQVSRAGDGETLGVHTLKHLRESGSLEQDADKVYFLARPSDKERDDLLEKFPEAHGDRILLSYLSKNRNGATGPVVLNYDRPTQRIWDFSEPEPGDVMQPAGVSEAQMVNIESEYDDDDLPPF